MKGFIKAFMLLVSILLIMVSISFADQNRRDGNWWRQGNKLMHVEYMTGFFDGMDLGNYFSYWNMSGVKSQSMCISRVQKSYYIYDSYFNNLTTGQLSDGLDRFYNDFRNRNILVTDAVWIVVNEISGMQGKKLNTMIENYRIDAFLER